MPPTTEEHEQQYNSDYNGTRDNDIAPAPYERLAKDGGFGNGTTSTGGGGSSLSSMVEIGFKGKPIPTWKDQITLRSLVVSVTLGTIFGMLSIKESLAAGTLSPVNIYTSVVGYSFIKAWLTILETSGIVGQPFTRQENAIIQSCVLGITGVCFSGGLGNYLFAMSSVVAARFPIGNDPQNIKNPGTAWIMAFLFVSSFAGFFFVIPLQKYMILNLKLLYPGGHSIGALLNTIHAPLTDKFSRKRLSTLGKFFSISFFWNCFVWMFSGTGKNCGFSTLPIFGFKARDKSFYFEFYSTHVGVGMLCPYSTSISMLVGSILSWGILYPYIQSKRGIWYDANLDSATDYRGFGGYRFNLGLALILGDSAFHLFKNLIARLICKSRNKGMITSTADHNCTGHHHLPVNAGTRSSNPDRESNDIASCTNCCTDTQIRTQNFLNELIPTKVAIVGVVALVALSAILLPIIFPAVKWYYVLCMYAVAFPVSFSKSHVAGLTDMNPSAHFGRLTMFIFGGWTPASHGGVLVALVACGVVMNFTSPGSQLMSDLKTGYLTLTSPRSIFVSKLFGNMIGCIISPLIFKYYTSHYPGLGTVKSPFSAAMAPYFRSGAITSLQGFKGLPMYTVHFCIAFFTAAIVINIIKELLPEKVAKYVPIPIVMGIPFYVGGYISISFCLGGLIVFLWKMKNRAGSDAYSHLIGAALICGDGLWILQESILELLNLMPPACASFVPT